MALTTVPVSLSATALTLTTAAQPNITSVGTLTALTVDNIGINGDTITLTGTSATGFIQTSGGTVQMGSSTSDSLILYTDNTAALTIDTSQNATFAGTISGTLATAAQPNITSLGTLSSLSVGAITSTGKLSLNDSTYGGWIQSNTSVRIDIDNDNNQTDRAFIVSKNNGATSLLTILENTAATFAGNISIDAASGNPYVSIKTAGTGNNPFTEYRAGNNTVFDTAAIFSGTTDRFRIGYGASGSISTDLFSITQGGDTTIAGGLAVDTTTFNVDNTNNRVGIGTATPQRLLTLFENDQPVFQITNNTSGGQSTRGLIQYMASGTTTAIFDNQGSGSGGQFTFMQAGATRMVINTNGNVLIGATTSSLPSSGTPGLEVAGSGFAGMAAISRFDNNAYGPSLFLVKSRAANASSHTIVADDDNLGAINWTPDDGTNRDTYAASIVAKVDGTPGANDMPTRLEFMTTADGAASPTTRMTILNDGNVGVNETVPQNTFHVKGATRLTQSATHSHALNAGTVLEVRGNSIGSGVVDEDYFKGFKIALNDQTEWGSQAQFSVGRWQDSGNTSRSSLVISLGHGAINSSSNADVDVMTMRSDGHVGIGTTSPQASLHVNKSSNVKIARFSTTGAQGITVGTSTTDSTGRAVHLAHDGTGSGYLHPYNYAGSSFDAMEIRSSNTAIKKADGNTALNVNAAGIVTQEYLPAFHAYYNANTYVPNNNSVFAHNATRFDNGGNYDTTNHRFTAPVAGVYQIYFRTIIYGSGNNGHISFRINGAGAAGANGHYSFAINAWNVFEMHMLKDLAANDYVDVYNNSRTVTYYHGNAWNEFSGYLVG